MTDCPPDPPRRASFAYLYERFPSFVQTFVYREAIEMERQGMAPWLVSIRRPEDAGNLAELEGKVFYLPEPDALRAEIDALNAAGKLPVRFRRAIAEWRKQPDSNRVFEAVWLAPRLRERGIRHVHAHFGGLAARTAWLLKSLAGITYSFTGHANDIFCENDFPITNAMLVRGAHLIVTETDYAREWMARKYPSARGKLARVYNGIATEDFAPRSLAGSRETPRIISVGRYVEKKGFGDLIEACRLLQQRTVPFSCVIIGSGPLAGSLQEQIDRAGLSHDIRLAGPWPQEQVRQALASAHIFALAAIPEQGGGSDNLPTVIAEAMLAGLPVVSTRVAGIPEMVEEGSTGLLVAPGEPAAFSLALETLLSDPERAGQMGARGRTLAKERFSIGTTVRSLKRLLVQRCRVDPPPEARAIDSSLQSGFWTRFFSRSAS